jgi:hypothetical protein
MKMFFARIDDEIELRARAEGDGVVGDFLYILKPGDNFRGIDYDDLAEHQGGTITVDDDGAAMIDV